MYDVSNRYNPILKNTFSIAGYYFDGRMLENGFMYLINKFPIDSEKVIPWYDIGFGKKVFSWNWIHWYPSWIY